MVEKAKIIINSSKIRICSLNLTHTTTNSNNITRAVIPTTTIIREVNSKTHTDITTNMLHSIGIMTNITKATVVTNLICMMVEGETHTMKKTIDITSSIKVATPNNSTKSILNTLKISRNSTMARINRGRSETTQITKITTKNIAI